MVCNVVAVADLLTNAACSRFVVDGIPPVYLACALNMDRDDVDGTIFTLEPAIREHQELCEKEATNFMAVRQCELSHCILSRVMCPLAHPILSSSRSCLWG
jgi:hypothetical protein